MKISIRFFAVLLLVAGVFAVTTFLNGEAIAGASASVEQVRVENKADIAFTDFAFTGLDSMARCGRCGDGYCAVSCGETTESCPVDCLIPTEPQ